MTQPFPWNIKRISGASGVVILGDGRLAIAIDPAQPFRSRRQAGDDRGLLVPESRKKPVVLVADDSLTSRTLERTILESAGYEVVLAMDGEQAWQVLQVRQDIQLLVSDVEMPHLTGLQLAARVREHDRFASLPIVLVTNLGSEEDRAAGAAAGADEYLVKGLFDQEKLLEAVRRYV